MNAPRRAPRPLPLPRRASRGFTLVELLVAMAAGLVVAMAAFLLSKNATRFFQHEARVSAAQLAATLGMNRLGADIQRASFMSSANVFADPLVCGSPAAWPAGMAQLAGVAMTRRGSEINHPGQLAQSNANRLRPDSIVLGGNFNTSEQFYFRALTCSGGICAVDLQPDAPAIRRTLARAAGGGEGLTEIFTAGRILRILIRGQTRHMFGVIRNVTIVGPPDAPASVTVNLEAAPALPAWDGDCGLRPGSAHAEGGFVNPVSRIRYDIRSLVGDPSYGALVTPVSPAVTGDNGRTELVRVELDAADNEVLPTVELISEYAVDLKFGIASAVEDANPDIKNPVITRYPIAVPEDANVYTIGAAVTNLGAAPQRIRSLQVRLSTRTRAPDRGADLGARPDGRKLRFVIPGILPSVNVDTDPVPPGSLPVFARMRTLYADFALPNQGGITW